MSIASPLDSETTPRLAAQVLKTAAVRPVETVAFWAAVALPLAYPALMFGGLDGRELFLLVAALALHAATLVAGRNHNRDTA